MLKRLRLIFMVKTLSIRYSETKAITSVKFFHVAIIFRLIFRVKGDTKTNNILGCLFFKIIFHFSLSRSLKEIVKAEFDYRVHVLKGTWQQE